MPNPTSGVRDTQTGARTMSRTRRRRLTVAALVAIDAVAILCAGLVATWLWFGSFTAPVNLETTELHISFWQLALIVVPLWVAFLALTGLYDLDRVTWGLSETGRVARALSMGVVALILATFLAKLPGLSRGWTLLAWMLSIVMVLTARGILAVVIALVRRRGRLMRNTLVVGSNAESGDIIRVLRQNPEAGLVPVGCLASSQAERLGLDFCSGEIPVLGTARDVADIVAATGADCVIIASTAFDHDVLARIIAELRAVDVDVHISSGLFEVLTSRVLVNEVAGVPLITVKGISLSKGNLLVKRVFDLVVAGLIVVSWHADLARDRADDQVHELGTRSSTVRLEPVVTGGRSRCSSSGRCTSTPTQRLADLVSANEASGPLFKMKDDPRVTSVGKWLRKFSLDEFPQLINVLKGEMSLVGPRPPLPYEVESYSVKDWRRLEVVPGMTGLWQVSGRSSLTFDEMVALDLFYIENWSVGTRYHADVQNHTRGAVRARCLLTVAGGRT